MQNEIFSQFQPARFGLDSFSELNALNIRTWNRLAEINWELTRLNLETGVEQVKALANPQGYNELFSIESDLTTRYKGKAAELTRQWVSAVTESQQEYRAIFSNRDAATTPVKSASSAGTAAATAGKKKRRKKKAA